MVFTVKVLLQLNPRRLGEVILDRWHGPIGTRMGRTSGEEFGEQTLQLIIGISVLYFLSSRLLYSP